MLTRRAFLTQLATVASSAVAWSVLPACRWSAVRRARSVLPAPGQAPFDHVVVLMMENRSFDHLLGWLPGANGHQAGLTFADAAGSPHPTHDLAPDFQGCAFRDPAHSWEAGLEQVAGGRADGFLRTAPLGDTYPTGFYTRASLPVLGALAEHYTTIDNYFCSLLAPTFPNRLYQHAAQTDRDHNHLGLSRIPLTIWDRLAKAGLRGRYYFSDLPFLALFGTRYKAITRPFDELLSDAAAGRLAHVSFVDPPAARSAAGLSRDDHPHGDIRAGEAFIGQVYRAVRESPSWPRTIFVVNFDEWGGFFDHVPPPKVVDDHIGPPPGPHPDYRQLGFRVPCIVASPFAPARVFGGGAPFEHTSILRMIEWRWGLRPMTARDRNARNLAEALDLSVRRTDSAPIPAPAPPALTPCAR